MDLLQAAVFVGFGLFVGAYGTLVGVGGGFLIVPMLLFVGVAPENAAGTSLVVVFFNAVSGAVSYGRQKRVDYATGVKFGLATVPGAVIGAYVASFLPSRVFNALFGFLLISVAFFLIARPEAAPQSLEGHPEEPLPLPHGWVRRTIVDARGDVFVYTFNERTGIALSFLVGFLSSMFGIGGGIIHVPAFVHLFSFPAHIATATSQFILGISAGVGSLSHLGLGHVLFLPALLLGIGVIVGAQLSAELAHRVHGRWLIRLLSIALVVAGVRLLVGALLVG